MSDGEIGAEDAAGRKVVDAKVAERVREVRHAWIVTDEAHVGKVVRLFVDDFEENLPPARALGMTAFLHSPDDPARTLRELERLFGVPLGRS